MNSLPPSLVRFESELGGAIRRRSHRRPLRLAVRTALATAAVAAIALGTLSAVSGSDPSAVARAAAVLSGSDGSVIHVVLVTDTPAGTERSESWERIGADNAVREIHSGAGGSYETSTAGGESQIYDPARNTIYVQADVTKPDALRAAKAGQVASAKALDAAKLAKAAREGVPSRRSLTTDRFRTKIGALLDSGDAHEDGHVTVDGRDAIRIVAADGGMSLLVDATTYEPLEWRAGTEVTRFPTFERLSAADAALFSLTAQHPGATVDRDAGDYRDAFARFNPQNVRLSEDETKKAALPKPGS